MSARYYRGGNGRRFFYQSEATFRCPFGENPPGWLQDALATSEDKQVQTIDAALLFRKAHTALRLSPFADGRCRACGAEIEKVGYATWIEEPWPTEKELRAETAARVKAGTITEEQALLEVSSALSTRALNTRLGSTHRRAPGSHRHWPLKRDAIQWAREESELDRSYAREEAQA